MKGNRAERNECLFLHEFRQLKYPAPEKLTKKQRRVHQRGLRAGDQGRGERAAAAEVCVHAGGTSGSGVRGGSRVRQRYSMYLGTSTVYVVGQTFSDIVVGQFQKKAINSSLAQM